MGLIVVHEFVSAVRDMSEVELPGKNVKTVD